MLLFKHIFDEGFGEKFIGICRMLCELHDKKTALEYLESVLKYAVNAYDKITQEEMRQGVITSLPLEGEQFMPTVFEQLREEGRQEGREEGLKAGIELALELKYRERRFNLLPKYTSQRFIGLINPHRTSITKSIKYPRTEESGSN